MRTLSVLKGLCHEDIAILKVDSVPVYYLVPTQYTPKTQYHMESALYGIYSFLVFVSEILLVRCAHSFDF